MMLNQNINIALAGLIALPACVSKPTEENSKPNVIVILVDDMGYSDLGCYGSEISTPNIDAMAKEGLRFTQFYNAARCCPTRASLLTGLYPHQVGMGKMVQHHADKEKEGPYQGYLNNQCVTLAEVMKSAGYTTLMSGKWHVGEFHPQYPVDRGFDKYFGLISGAVNYFDHTKGKGFKRKFAYDNEDYTPPTKDYYFTTAITDSAVSFIDSQKDSNNPFFMYLAYTAPHYPLHALPEDIEKYKNMYHIGWDSLRTLRYQKQIELGVVDSNYVLTARDDKNPAWNSLSDSLQEAMAYKMAIYAAMVDNMDQGVGEVLAKLEEMGEKENTLILFLSDNGACAEKKPLGGDWRNNGSPTGSADSFESYGGAWANASNTPFRYYKQWIHEGGIRTPFIAYWPGKIKNPGSFVHHPAHIIDIMTSLCEIGGVTYPTEYKGNQIIQPEGISFIPLLKGESIQQHEYIAWEHFKNKGIRQGDYKLVAEKNKEWELYNIKNDPVEMNDIIDIETAIADSLKIIYEKWANDIGVYEE